MKTICIAFFITITGCTGWSIAGYELNPDNEQPVINTIVDQDSVEHFYYGGVHQGTNWCITHSRYENVEIK